MILLLCISWPSSSQLTHLITDRVYLDDELSVIILVDCRAMTTLIKFQLGPNVLT